MIASSRTLASDNALSPAVCIVGGGPAGITLACELDGSGIPVVLLEAAGTGIGGAVSQDPYEGTTDGAHPSPAHFRRRAFGGTTTIWGGRCVPYDAIDFEARDYVANSGWPIAYDEVARHYPRAMRYLDAGESEFCTAQALPQAPPTLPGLAADPRIRTDLIERYSLPTDFGSRYRKQLQASSNVRVVLHAHVLRIIKDPHADRIEAVEFVAQDGTLRRVRAEVFVLAAGGIETPRLLLASDPRGVGFGNDAGNLGRYYTCHVENVLGTLRATSPGVVFDFERTRDGVYGRRKIQIDPAAQRRERLLNIAFRLHYPDVANPLHGSPVLSAVYLAKRTLIPEYRRVLQHGRDGDGAQSLAHWRNVARGLPGLAGFGVQWLLQRVLAERKLPYVLVANADGSYPIEFNAEQTPLRDSRITLGRERDTYGMPRVHVSWRMCDADVDSICRAYRLLKQGLEGGGSCTLEFDPATLRERVEQSIPVGGHHIGTARMAADPRDGVVDRQAAVFGLPNLYVAGSATFPTSGHANPTLTIVAMSIRMAAHLKTRLNAFNALAHAA